MTTATFIWAGTPFVATMTEPAEYREEDTDWWMTEYEKV